MRVCGFSNFARVRGAALLLAASTACWTIPAHAEASATPAVPAHAALGDWGVDLSARDLSVQPGDDFQRYASGNWLAKTQIAADKPEVSSFYDLYDLSQDQLKELITNAPADSKYGALYHSMMDEAAAEAAGIAPLKQDLANIAAIKTKTEMARYMGTTDHHFGSSLFGFYVQPDTADASINALNLSRVASACRAATII